MSRLIDTELGRFRQVTDGARNWFMFECPCCGEMLPLTEEHLAGRAPIDHESRRHGATFCKFQGTRDFGRQLIAKMQVQILMGYKPYHDEGESDWQPSGGGIDG